MNHILVQGLFWLAFLFCLYCLRNWHKHKADVNHKYKATKLCVTIYGIYRTTHFLQEAIIAKDIGVRIPSVIILVCLNVLLYVQLIRLLNPKVLKVIAAFQKEVSTTRTASLFYQLIYLFIFILVWIMGIQKMIVYYQLSTITVALTDVWDFVQTSLYVVLPVTIFYTFLLDNFDRKRSLFRGFCVAVVFWLFIYCLPGWLLIFEEKPLVFYGFLLLCQEYIMYQFLKNKVRKELLLYQDASLGIAIGKLMTKIK